VLQIALYEKMTETVSTVSQPSSTILTAASGGMPTTEGNSSVSSPLGVAVRFEYAVIFIGVVGLVGNALILYALVASKQHKKHMLIVNQNALDLFSCCFLLIHYVMTVCNIYLTGTLGYWLCIMILGGNTMWWGTNGSMINLAIITIDRYLKVVYPIWSRKWLRPWVIYSAMAFSWFVGIVYNVVIVVFSSAVIDGVCYSYVFFESYVAEAVAFFLYFLFFYFVILAIFIFCYGRILVAIRRQAQVMASHNATGSNAAQAQSNKIQTNVIKTMIFVSAFYAIAYLPNMVYCLLGSVKLVSNLSLVDNVYYATEFLAFLYTSANPFIYAIKFDPVRKILVTMIPCKKTIVQSTSGPP